MYKKLFIPGPTHVVDEVLEAMAIPMIGHRDSLYSDMHGEVVEKLKKMLYTDNRIYLSTSSSTGMMEGAIRNCVQTKALMTDCGAFSKRWAQIATANGKETEVIKVEMGEAITPEMVDEKLAQGGFDSVFITHNETSTGVTNPLKEIAALVKEKYPDVLVLVDAVSIMSGAEIRVDDWDLDVVLAGTQKAFALPPGLCVIAVSDAAFERSKTTENKGYYFDFVALEGKAVKSQTPATPALSLINALNVQMDRIIKEGVENRFTRHAEMAKYVQDWAKEYFALYVNDEKYLSPTITNIKNTRGISVADLNKELAKRGAMLSNGYGALKEKSFRIAHMGDLQMEDLKWLTGQIEDILEL
ncbi:MAG: alanine--glyoxylate aminotransferase family protein [Anaerolineae bacterium]|jgi:predicted phosphoserine aminotransferase|nr:alanine--glyoxylate aminotransferase family protein [Anaerolineae bacterium]MBT7075956.1 alanine--glyoxylate aminotransferase family protein [Anaerolineae bacterium]MBT7783644.1 alanine--glyoxylate aminotransferase family protein [Anaerolineae bacterium]